MFIRLSGKLSRRFQTIQSWSKQLGVHNITTTALTTITTSTRTAMTTPTPTTIRASKTSTRTVRASTTGSVFMKEKIRQV